MIKLIKNNGLGYAITVECDTTKYDETNSSDVTDTFVRVGRSSQHFFYNNPLLLLLKMI